MNAFDYSHGEGRPALAKILATIGPASEDEAVLRRLIELGASAFRLNFSHGTVEEHKERLQRIRAVAKDMDKPVAVLGDLPGPKIRVGKVPDEGIELHQGDDVVFTESVGVAEQRQEDGKTVTYLPTTYPKLIDEVNPGQRVLINDGAIRMLAIECDHCTELRCVVTIPGLVTTGKGINLPETDISAPAIAEHDWNLACWAIENGVDFLAMSFVRSADEITEFISRIDQYRGYDTNADCGPGTEAFRTRVRIVAKIEKPQAVADIDRIADAADIIMVARGDLGVEMDIARVPAAQKRIIEASSLAGTPVIVATQMLETMITSATPTRAEASDVANAVFDGTDAVMLSGETAVGAHPDLVVDTMRRIIVAAEERTAELPPRATPPRKFRESRNHVAAMAHGAWHTAHDIHAQAVVVWSQSGGSAQFLSQNNFGVPIVAYSSDRTSCRRMALLGGVIALHREAPPNLTEWTDMVDDDLQRLGIAPRGAPVIMMAGKPLGSTRNTNTMATHLVGQPGGGYRGHG